VQDLASRVGLSDLADDLECLGDTTLAYLRILQGDELREQDQEQKSLDCANDLVDD